MLPSFLRWSDGRAAQFSASVPEPEYFDQGAMYTSQQPMHDMFTADLSHPPAPYPYATDVRVALLRTRYHHIKYLIYRPCLYKALHHASAIGPDDAEAVAECLKSCLKWPLIMAPTCYRKRLIPCHFFWTHNLLGVLIILHLSRQLPILQQIRAQLCDSNFDLEANETANLAIAWIRDLKDVDPTAYWCWGIVSRLYRLEDG